MRYIFIRRTALAVALCGLILAGCSQKEQDGTPGAQPTNDRSSQPSGIQALPVEPVTQVKLLVETAGLHRVTADQLAAAGFDLTVEEAQDLTLSNGGQAVPLTVEPAGETFAITFYGQPRESRYGVENVYWLRRADDGSLPARPEAVSAAPNSETAGNTGLTSLRQEESNIYLSQTPEGSDHWVWETLFAPAVFTSTFDLPNYAGGSAELALSLWANTEDRVDPDHRAAVRVNGIVVAQSEWDGKGWHTITETIPAEILQVAKNSLTIELPGDTGAAVDMVYLDWIDLKYQGLLKTAEGRGDFLVPGDQDVVIQGLGTDSTLWDVTTPLTPTLLTGAVADDSGLRFHTASGERQIAAAASGSFLTPAVTPALGADLRDNPEGADYIAIAAPEFMSALQPLVDFRRSQGLRVTVASIDDVYDTFSHGMADPASIHDYMTYARDNWTGAAPRFLLLAGDATYDYQNFLPNSTGNYVPAYLMSTHFVGETASDNWFVSLDEENDLPGMAVGRIPAQTAQQVADVVAKTLAYEQDTEAAAWAGRALFVADNAQEGFQTIADDLSASSLPGNYEVDKIYLGSADDPAKQITESMDQGVGLITYIGHGSMNVWGKDKMFQISDNESLSNGKLPFLMTMTCLVGYFHHPTATSMGEELLLNPSGGVVAAFVPTSESLASDQKVLAANIYGYLFQKDVTVGEAIMLGKRDLDVERNLMQDLIETFTLLGDPALVLHQPG